MEPHKPRSDRGWKNILVWVGVTIGEILVLTVVMLVARFIVRKKVNEREVNVEPGTPEVIVVN